MNSPLVPLPQQAHPQLVTDTNTAEPILLRYWDIVFRRRWLVIAIVAAAVAAGIAVTLLQTPAFTAEARVEIRRSQDNVTDVEAVTPSDADQDLEFYQTQYALLEARSLATRVVRRLNLTRTDDFFNTFGVELEEGLRLEDGSAGSLSREQVEERNREAVDLFLRHVGIAPIRGSALVDLRFTSPDPVLSRDITNAWAEEYIQSNLDRRFASSIEAREFLSEQLQALRERLETSERDLVNYAANSGIVTLSQQRSANGRTETDRTLTIADIEALNTELAVATADRIRAESRLQRGVDTAIVENATLSGLRQNRAEIAASLSSLEARFGPEYPPLQSLEAQLAQLERSITQEESRIRTAARTDFEQARQREQELRGRITGLKQNLVSEQQASIQYNIYQREVDTNRQLYDGLLQRFKEIGVAGVGTNNVSIVDRAEVPRSPSSPNLLINLLASLIGGLAIAAGVVFALEQIDSSLRDPTAVRELGLTLLGVIPKVEGDEVIDAVLDRKSAISEAYVAAQTNLSLLTDRGLPDSFILTSTRPSEGKSSSAVALAISLARTGNRTILIDADIRSPSVGTYLGIANEKGLTNYLTGSSDLAALLAQTEQENLTVMTGGPQPPNAAELFSTRRFGELITELKRQFDIVVVDAPPMLGLADVPLISNSVDGIIYTIESNGVQMRGIRNSIERLRIVNAHVFGALVTKYEQQGRSGFGYGYGYGYGYDYGYGDNAKDTKA
ncbi:GumC family protein [Erythrobacter aurantius]|uniref:GumC family protein n=1 Tax=Erythrobacter aurantius TaxID=2909249 RepID=UPI00207953FF|nr:polysaccharide biosynthesis tyrosine autokinase [Erythrobacter aurantius]